MYTSLGQMYTLFHRSDIYVLFVYMSESDVNFYTLFVRSDQILKFFNYKVQLV